jgi:TetR/AcrR family acrAB operon transcriptional repressor
MVRKTKEEALETRQRILVTAECIFHHKGVAHTSLHDIAEAAGVTRGAIYWHFKNKTDLIDAMLQQVVLPMEEAFRVQVEDTQLNPIEQLRSCNAIALRSLRDDERIRRIVEILFFKCEYVDETADMQRRHISSRALSLHRIENWMRSAVDAKLLMPGLDPAQQAISLHALTDGLLMNWLLVPDSFDVVELGTQMTDIFLRGLGWRPDHSTL